MSTDIVQQASHANPFDSIRRIHADGTEFWSARDLAPLLGYATWAKFADSIDRARAACKASDHETADHFAFAGKMVTVGSGARKNRRG